MTLSTQNYPKWFHADGVGCEWLLSAPEGFIIALEFNHFQVNYLHIRFYQYICYNTLQPLLFHILDI